MQLTVNKEVFEGVLTAARAKNVSYKKLAAACLKIGFQALQGKESGNKVVLKNDAGEQEILVNLDDYLAD